MLALYELLDLLPNEMPSVFAPRLNKLLTFLKQHPRMTKRQCTEQYLGDIKREKYFNKLKNELKQALIRYLIANPSRSDNKHKALIENCYRDFATYKILLVNSKREVAIEKARTLLPKVQIIELHDLAHTLANDLLFHYSSIDISPGLVKKYGKIREKELEFIKVESFVRGYHSKVGLICNTKDSFTPAIVKDLIEAIEHTQPLLHLGKHHINRLIYLMIIARYVAEYDYENILNYCEEALCSFPIDHPNIRSLRFLFINNKIPALLALGYPNEAKERAREAGELVEIGSFNWHLALLRRISVCLHAGDYKEAYDLYKAHTQYPCIYENLSEYWKIIKGYLYFLIGQNHIETYEEERFHLGKFLNEVPLYSKDKAGNNINILLLQILIQLQREQFGHIIDRTDSLREYARKYTRNPETKRANIFIKMILKMEKAQFHRSGTETKTKKLLEQLCATPLHLGQNLAIEIIPYEILWQEILSLLENKFRAKTVRRRGLSRDKKK